MSKAAQAGSSKRGLRVSAGEQTVGVDDVMVSRFSLPPLIVALKLMIKLGVSPGFVYANYITSYCVISVIFVAELALTSLGRSRLLPPQTVSENILRVGQTGVKIIKVHLAFLDWWGRLELLWFSDVGRGPAGELSRFQALLFSDDIGLVASVRMHCFVSYHRCSTEQKVG